ncbi:MAG: HAD family hydrolase [Gemmataceae bacterium]
MHICLFDIDGTLLSSGGAGKAAMEGAIMSAFGVAEIRGQVPFSGRTDRAIIRDLFHMHDIADTPENWQHFVSTYLHLLPECLHRHEGRVLPGILWLLEHLAERDDVAVGLLTGNLREGAKRKLGHYDMFHHFTFGGFGDLHFERDDVAREALTAVHHHLNGSVSLERTWVIGDTPLDIACARAIGARVLAVATGWHSYDLLAAENPDLLVTDLSDPAPLLQVLS